MWHEAVSSLGVLALAAVLDVVFGEPPSRVHPVVWMGRAIGLAGRLAPRRGASRQFVYGLLMAVAVPAGVGIAAYFAGRVLHAAGDVAYVVGSAILLKSTFSMRMLGREALKVAGALRDGRLAEARRQLGALVSRDTATLGAGLAASAAIESAAENTTDSFVAPWLAFALFGLPGAFAYRALNTMDAMIGYHGRYEYLGKAAARLDDAANLLPARLAGVVLAASSALGGASARSAWRVMWRDHARTESPNAGWTMAAMAGALGTRLEKPGHYVINDTGAAPTPQDVTSAVRVTWWVAALCLMLAGGVLVLRYVVW